MNSAFDQVFDAIGLSIRIDGGHGVVSVDPEFADVVGLDSPQFTFDTPVGNDMSLQSLAVKGLADFGPALRMFIEFETVGDNEVSFKGIDLADITEATPSRPPTPCSRRNAPQNPPGNTPTPQPHPGTHLRDGHNDVQPAKVTAQRARAHKREVRAKVHAYLRGHACTECRMAKSPLIVVVDQRPPARSGSPLSSRTGGRGRSCSG
jgi:hypothetical protein